MDVLVTDGIMKKSLAVVRSIAPLTTSTGVISSYRTSMAGVSRYVDREHHIDRSDPAAYVADLTTVIDGHDYDYLLPVGGWTTNALANHRSELTPAVDVVLPGREAMRTAQEKWETYSLAKRLDVPVPETIRATADADLDRLPGSEFPVVVKAPTESAPRFVEYPDSTGELRRTVRRYRNRYGDDPLVQEYLRGEGCGFFALYLDGRCAGGYSHTRIREYPASGGISACAVSDRDSRLAAIGTTVLDSLEWNGPAMVEFKRDDRGTPHLIELNPKLWGSLDLGIESGLNFPEGLLQYMHTGKLPRYTFTPSRYHWPLSGDLQHAIGRPAATPAVLSDLISSNTRSNLEPTDPLPHALELAKAILSPFVDE